MACVNACIPVTESVIKNQSVDIIGFVLLLVCIVIDVEGLTVDTPMLLYEVASLAEVCPTNTLLLTVVFVKSYIRLIFLISVIDFVTIDCDTFATVLLSAVGFTTSICLVNTAVDTLLDIAPYCIPCTILLFVLMPGAILK